VSKKAVIFEQDGPLGIITLNRPDQKNAITAEMVAELGEIADTIGWDSQISVLVLTGAGEEAFCAGTDREEISFYADREELVARLSAAAIIGSFNRPVIAALNADAIGQGLELALASDIRICAETARLAMPQVNDRDIPWDGGTQRLARLVGASKALEMILLGESLDASEALKIGLVTRVVPQKELMETAMGLARDLAAKSPIALRAAKEAIRKGMDMTLAQGLLLEADLYFLLHTTHDRTEGIKAYQEKREPRFNGK
jgi:enoyl-CoA hydratase/carnithine racemase